MSVTATTAASVPDHRAQFLSLLETGLSRAIARVLALEQGQTDRLCEYSPKELLRLVFDVFGDQEVLDRYDQARSHQQQLMKEVESAAHELSHTQAQLSDLSNRVNSYQQYQLRLKERERLATEVLPVMQWSEAREKLARVGVDALGRGDRDDLVDGGVEGALLGDGGLPAVRLRVALAAAGHRALSDDLAIRLADRFTTYREEEMFVFPGAHEAIDAFKALGIKLALVTNGAADMQRAKVERFALGHRFDHIQIEGEHGFGKPEERAYLHAMDALGVTASDTWMIGDNLEWEVVAPQRLGIYAVWMDVHGVGLPPGSTIKPDRIVRSLTELVPARHK